MGLACLGGFSGLVQFCNFCFWFVGACGCDFGGFGIVFGLVLIWWFLDVLLIGLIENEVLGFDLVDFSLREFGFYGFLFDSVPSWVFGVVNLGCEFGGLMTWCSSSDCGVWFEMDCILVKLNFGLLWL